MAQPVEVHLNKPLPVVVDWDEVSEVHLYTHHLQDLEVMHFLTEAQRHRKTLVAKNEAAREAMYRRQ